MMRTILLSLSMIAVACGGPGPEPKVARQDQLCHDTAPETYGVLPFGNKTKATMELAGGSDLLMASMQNSGCFRLIERERLDALINEMKLCSDANPDKEYMDCSSFAKVGHILGLQRMVISDVIFFEKDVKGGELAAKIPGVPMAGIELGKSYAALSLSVRAVDVETAKVTATTVVHALLPSEKFDVGASAPTSGLDLRASIRDKSPFGEELHRMLQRAAVDLAKQIGGANAKSG